MAHPLASSFQRRNAREFTDRQKNLPDPLEPSKNMPKVLYIIKLDPDGCCLQGNYLGEELATQTRREKEWLFSAYSAFQVISAKDSNTDTLKSPGVRFEITLKACPDNTDVSDDVPTAPWH